MKKNVLITGGAGFIGSHLVDRLIAENAWKVTILDDFNNFYSPVLKYHNIAKHTENQSFSLLGGNVISKQVLESLFSSRKFDCIVHLADRAGAYHSIVEPKLYELINVHGTLNLLEIARNYKVKKFIFGSAAAVYGENASIPFSEEMVVGKPLSPYGATKTVGEMLCHTYSYLYGLCCVCLRFFTVYGPRQRPDMAIHKFTKQIEKKQPITFYSDGTSCRDYVYISDVVDGIRAAMDYEDTNFEIFNLGTGKSVELNSLVNLLENALQKKAVIKKLPPEAGIVNETLADIKAAEKLLNYHPKVSIEQGIRNFIRWFREERFIEESDFAEEEIVELSNAA